MDKKEAQRKAIEEGANDHKKEPRYDEEGGKAHKKSDGYRMKEDSKEKAGKADKEGKVCSECGRKM